MLKFLRENEVADQFRKLDGSDKRLAIAFWGKEASRALGLEGASAKGVQIICNLESGATNPDVIERLIASGADVKSNRRLHAKVYAVGAHAIVGSSNASGNGLAVEGHQVSAWLEANVLTDDPSMVADIRGWFNNLWQSTQSVTVTAAMIAEARVSWAVRRGIAPERRETGSLLEACRDNPELFRNVYLAIYEQDLSKAAKAVLSEANGGESRVRGLKPEDFGDLWGYSADWSFPDGAWLIDIHLKQKRQTKMRPGFARVHDPVVKLKVEGDESLILAVGKSGVTLGSFTEPLTLTKPDVEFLEARIGGLASSLEDDRGIFGWPVPLPQAVEAFDRVDVTV